MSFKMGYSGMEVQTIRAALASYGFKPNYAVMDPNLYDAWVEAAVKAFQLSVGVKPDGIVGPITWNALSGQSPSPGTSPASGAASASPSTSPSPGQLPTTVAVPAGPLESKGGMILLMLGLGLGFVWWKNRKGGSTLAGLPFGDDDEKAAAKKEREQRRRQNAARIAKITDAYEIEMKRLSIDPVKAPGHAQALMNRVALAVDKEDELTTGTRHESIPFVARQEELKEKAARSARGLVGGQQRIAKKNRTYKQESTKTGRSMFPGNTSPTTSLRERTEGEDELWLERVESGRAAPQASKRIVVSSKRYHTDKAYRASEEADARKIANAEKREVVLVNDRGVTLYKFHPNVRDFKDAASERLIEEVENDAKKKNCPKAVRNLFRVRPLALDLRSEQKLDKAAAAVAKNCSEALEVDLEQREEAREEAGGERPTSATIREVRNEVGLTRDRKKTAAVFTKKAIEREIEKGNISEEDGEALLIMARDEERRLQNERDAIFEPPRSTSKMVRKRKGEKDAHIFVSPEGRTRTLRK